MAFMPHKIISSTLVPLINVHSHHGAIQAYHGVIQDQYFKYFITLVLRPHVVLLTLQHRDELLMSEPVYMEDHHLTCLFIVWTSSRISSIIYINSLLRVSKCPLAQLVERQTVNTMNYWRSQVQILYGLQTILTKGSSRIVNKNEQI